MSDELVTQDDVEAALLRPLTAVETGFIGRNIATVSSQLRQAMTTVDDRIAAFADDPRPANALDPAVVASRLALVIKRYIANVEGVASKSRTDGPFSTTLAFASYGKLFGGSGVQGELQVTAADVAAINGLATPTAPGTINIKPALLAAPRSPRSCW